VQVLGVARAGAVQHGKGDEADHRQRGQGADRDDGQRPPAAQHQRRDDEGREHGDRVPVGQPHAHAGEAEQHQAAGRLLQAADQPERRAPGRQHREPVTARLDRLLQHERAAG
jgi:hypothetical protein